MEMSGANVIQLRPQAQAPGPVQPGGIGFVRLRGLFEQAEEHHEPERRLAFRDEDYYHNFDDGQWSQAEKRVLSERGQPTYTQNRVKRKVNFLMGMEQRGRTDPKALPRKPNSEAMAEVATDVLHAIEDKARFDEAASSGFFNLLIHGIIASEPSWDGEDIRDEVIPYEEFFRDPRAKKRRFADARFMGYAKWFSLEDAKALYTQPGQQRLLDLAAGQSEEGRGQYRDRPQHLYLVRDGKDDRVRIIVIYYRDGVGAWRLAHFCGAGELIDMPSPYVDEKGRARCGIEAEWLYMDRENRCYGVVRDMIGPQQEHNHMRAKLWHFANDRRFWYNEGAFGSDADGQRALAQAKRELAKVDGALRVNPGFRQGEHWGFLETGDQVSILMALLGKADEEHARLGPNAGLQGRGAASQSGRSRIVQQEAGMIEENNVFDRLSGWKQANYRAMFLLARQFWTDEMYIRVTDEEDGPRFVQLNQMIGFDPVTRAPVRRNDMARLDVDILIEEMPDVATIQQEQFETIANLLGAGVPPPYLAVMLKASNLRDKDKLIEQLMAPMQPDPALAQAKAVELAGAEAAARKTLAETERIAAETRRLNISAAARMAAAQSGLMTEPAGFDARV